MNFTSRSYDKEILDQDNIPFADIKQNMKELNFINKWLGGHAITIKGLKSICSKKDNVTICEIGCGGGDNLFALNNWCSKHNVGAKFIGIDIKQECIDFARSRQPNHIALQWIVNDYRQVSFENKPDIIFSSLFCHHFSDDDLVEQVRWMKTNSVLGFFVNDLERNPLAYYSIKFLTSIFSSSYLVKNDAPVSVLRGFKKSELFSILQRANAVSSSISRQWAFRYLVTYRHGG